MTASALIDRPGDRVEPTAKIVDLFAGPGGLDVAAAKLGIETIGVEINRDACETRDAAGLKTIKGDVRKHGPSDPRFHEANVLVGGPPCQTFTVAGNGAGRKALDDVLRFVDRMVNRENLKEIEKDLEGIGDERTALVLEPLRWILEAIDIRENPYEAIILEQVPAVLPVWEAYVRALRKEGYSAECAILRTEAYGVPQTRKRAVLIARRRGSVVFPPPTHRTYRKGVPRSAGDSRLKPWETMGDVLGRDHPFHVVSNYGTGGDPKARGRRTSDEPSVTVTGKIFRNRVVSNIGTEDRFQYWEAGRLQTFPLNYPWSGRDVGQQIGNAVPPRLAMHVICAALGWGSPSDDELQSLEKWSTSDPLEGSTRDRAIVIRSDTNLEFESPDLDSQFSPA